MDAKILLDKCLELCVGEEDDGSGEANPEFTKLVLDILKYVGQHLGKTPADFGVALGYLWGGYSTTLSWSAALAAAQPPLPSTPLGTLTAEQTEGSVIRFAREARKLHQVEVGNALDLPNWVISNWEKGKGGPTDEQRARLRILFERIPIQLPLKDLT